MSEGNIAESSTASFRAAASAPTPKPQAHTSTVPQAAASSGDAGHDEESDEETDAVDIKTLRSFNEKIQRFPASSSSSTLDPSNPFNPAPSQKIVIPKRGEKDFEPLNETVKLQEMMLKQSREALFEALTGVRGGSSQNISHALLTPKHPFPHIVVSRGNVQASMGHTVRSKQAEKSVSRTELLPEEALYLLERGSLQVWYGSDEGELGQWSDEVFGVVGATEMSVMQGYSTFIGKEGLSLERYQAYAYLKRLGYTVQRTRTFLPERFRDVSVATAKPRGFTLDKLAWLRPDHLLARLLQIVHRALTATGSYLASLARPGLGPQHSLLASWHGGSYQSLFAHLRIISAGHSQPINNPPTTQPSTAIPATTTYNTGNQYEALEENPYLPFFHVWQPSVNWSRKDWLKGTDEGLSQLPPNYWLAVVNVRSTTLPSLQQISDVFEILPHEAVPVFTPRTPKRPAVAPVNSRFATEPSVSYTERVKAALRAWLPPTESAVETPHPRTVGMHLKQGDRTLVVAVADSGNVGWMRLGRGGFEEYSVV